MSDKSMKPVELRNTEWEIREGRIVHASCLRMTLLHAADAIEQLQEELAAAKAIDRGVAAYRDYAVAEIERLRQQLAATETRVTDALEMNALLVNSLAESRKQFAAAEAEVARLSGMKSPTGVLSHEQQARAWEYVWESLWNMGMCSFLPDPCTGKSQNRVVQFVGDAIRQLKEAVASLADVRAERDNLTAVLKSTRDQYARAYILLLEAMQWCEEPGAYDTQAWYRRAKKEVE